MEKTNQQYDLVASMCRTVFKKKMHDYGTAWRILRISSMTDQIFIKAQRIRSIEMKGAQMVDDDILGVLGTTILGHALIRSN